MELRVMIPRVVSFLVMLPLLLSPGLTLCKPGCPMSLDAGASHAQRSCCSDEEHRACQRDRGSDAAEQSKPVQHSPYDNCCRIGIPIPKGLQPQQISRTFLPQAISCVSTMLASDSPCGELSDRMAGMGALRPGTIPISPGFTPLRI